MYAVDMATFSTSEGYIDVIINGNTVGFFDTDNDWREGQPVHITAWYKPEPYKEDKNE